MCHSQYIDETEEQAMEALRKNEHILRKLSEELLTKTKISGFVSLYTKPSLIALPRGMNGLLNAQTCPIRCDIS